jgi:hypothetical protein
MLMFVVALVVGELTRAAVISVGARNIIMQVGPIVASLAAAFFVMHYVIKKKFRGFRIRLAAGEQYELEPTRARTTRIWWTYAWRSLLYTVIATFVANIPLSFVLMAAAAVSPGFLRFAQFLTGLVLNGVVGLFVIYSSILDEDIAGFRVGLVPRDTPPLAVPASATSA